MSWIFIDLLGVLLFNYFEKKEFVLCQAGEPDREGFPTMIQNLLNGGKHSVKIIAGGVLPLLVKDDLSMCLLNIGF